MNRTSRPLLALTLALLLVGACGKKEQNAPAADPFRFVVYPGSRYLGQLTDLTKQAHKVINPAQEPPPTAIYDIEASVEQVAEYYAKEYGYDGVAPDATNDLSAAKPAAFYRTGDLATDTKSAEPLIAQLQLQVDVSKATGNYKAAEIAARPNRPRVTIQRPYFDMTTSQVVDRTIILMSK